MANEADIEIMDTKEAFYTLQSEMGKYEDEELNEEEKKTAKEIREVYKLARFGIKMEFDIYDYLNGIIFIKGKTGKALYRGRTLDLSEMWTEIERRTIKMKNWLIRNTTEETGIKPYD